MKRLSKLFTVLAVLTVTAFGVGSAPVVAVEVLVNGNLESSVSPNGWSLTTSITGVPGSSIPSLFEHNDGANQPTVLPGELGLLIKPQAGNQGSYEGLNHKSNLVLEQTVNGIAGRVYTFTGHTYWGGDGDEGTKDGYSGGVDLLHSGSPSDPTPEDPDDPPSVVSPTQSIFEMAFLNASNVVLGTPSVLDLRTMRTNDAMWQQHVLSSPAAPAGTTKVRVRAALSDIVENFGFQDVMLDNFSLRDNVVTGLERLTNPNLNTPGDPAGWTLTEGPMGADSSSFISFAQHAGASGVQGLWLRPFVNTTQFEPDIPTVFATLTQTVAGTAGTDYTFSAWTAWEQGYAGGIEGAGVQTLLKMEFLNAASAVIGTPLTLDLYAAGMRGDPDGGNIEPDDWQQFSLPGTAPAGTVSVRVSIDAQGMFNSFNNPQSAFFDDFSLNAVVAGVPGDYNGNSIVDAADYVLWRDGGPLQNDPTPGVSAADYDFWRSRFGATSGSGSALAAAIPEPTSCCLVLFALMSGGVAMRCRGPSKM